MQIDWITVSAQIVNFLILVWLLKRFLYHPVIDAMDQREQRIADKLDQAQQREREAAAQIQQYQDKANSLDQRSEQLLKQAGEQAEQEKQTMLEQARTDVAASREQWQLQVQQEKNDFLQKLRLQSAETVQLIARRALGDLANQSLEQQVIDAFIQRLESLDDDQRQALHDATGPVQVNSAFDLAPALRGKLTRAIHAQLAGEVDVNYAQVPRLICGIELGRGEQRLGWNLDDYMHKLSAQVEETLNPGPSASRAQA
jgi:F-type H+-transporting ATPase subunit b